MEKAIVVLVMTFVIVSGEIDLSVASVMGLAAVVLAWLTSQGVSTEVAVVVALAVGGLCGLFNGFWIAIVGLPSLAVTLAGLIGYRGLARLLIEDRSVGGFPTGSRTSASGRSSVRSRWRWSSSRSCSSSPRSSLQASGFGRYVYVLGNSLQVARFSGVRISRLRLAIFTLSGFVAALAGVLLAARLGAVRGSTAEGFELDIITMVLLGGVSIFGGRGHDARRDPVDPADPQPAQRPRTGERDGQHADRRRGRAADPVRPDPEPARRGADRGSAASSRRPSSSPGMTQVGLARKGRSEYDRPTLARPARPWRRRQ